MLKGFEQDAHVGEVELVQGRLGQFVAEGEHTRDGSFVGQDRAGTHRQEPAASMLKSIKDKRQVSRDGQRSEAKEWPTPRNRGPSGYLGFPGCSAITPSVFLCTKQRFPVNRDKS
jgi:hypothetical protein